MKLLRLLAVTVLALSFATPVLAQRTPAAAPTGEAAESRDLPAPDAAPTSAIDVTPLGVSSNPMIGSISVVHMFMGADWIVKTVMLLLLAMSLWSWTIILDKLFQFLVLPPPPDAVPSMAFSTYYQRVYADTCLLQDCVFVNQ